MRLGCVAAGQPSGISGTAAEVALMTGGQLVRVAAIPALPRERNVRIIFIGLSSKYLVLQGDRAPLRLTPQDAAALSLDVTLPAGIDPDDVMLVRLKLKDGRREVSHTSSLTSPFSKDDLVPLKIEAVDATASARRYRAQSTQALKRGEYALLIDRRFYDFGVN